MRTLATDWRRWPRRAAFGAALGSIVAAVVVGSGLAAAKAKPSNTSLPRIFGVARIGQVLSGDRGSWSNSPSKFDYAWLRCDRNGNSCGPISGATGTQYALTSSDEGRTIRFRVTATNSDGSTQAFSAQTALVVAAGKPANTAPPTISGTPVENSTLASTNGTWSNNPSRFDYGWIRCDKTGSGNCAGINGANKNTYTLTSADVGFTVKLRVFASNSAGNNSADSAPTPVISKFRGNGCPPGGNPDQVTAINGPARLLVDTLTSDPTVVRGSTQTLNVRFHVTSTCGGPVQGALVYATVTPYNQFAIPPEVQSGADGWATVTFQRLRGFPVSKRQRLITIFVRARKSGENVLAGISTRRLVSLRVNLRG
jgi:hypothetical protein